jgi:glycosyltransferase involved in cell wall biosynthesis
MLNTVSIIVPCYNQAQYLPDALDSVLAQTFSDWECIIVNDGSPDNTEEVALNYAKTDPRFIYVKKDNGGLSSARNYGIAHSHGKYILPLDADDKIHPFYIRECVDLLDADENIKLVYALGELFGDETGLWILTDYTLEELARRSIVYCSAIYRRVDFDRTTGYSEDMIYGLEDWDFWVSILKNGGDVVRIPKIYFYYRAKRGSMARSLDPAKFDYLQRKVYEHHQEFYDTHFGNPIALLNNIQTLELEVKELERQLDLLKKSTTWKIRNLISRNKL